PGMGTGCFRNCPLQRKHAGVRRHAGGEQRRYPRDPYALRGVPNASGADREEISRQAEALCATGGIIRDGGTYAAPYRPRRVPRAPGSWGPCWVLQLSVWRRSVSAESSPPYWWRTSLWASWRSWACWRWSA